MKQNSRKLRRFFSDQGYQNYYFSHEDDKTSQIIPSSSTHDQESMKNVFQQRTPTPSQKSETLTANPATLKLEDGNTCPVINSNQVNHTIVEIGQNSDQRKKKGNERFRWNLLFNVLVWLIVPLPFWIPLISNTIAYYLLLTIQAVFVFEWTSMSRVLLYIFISFKRQQLSFFFSSYCYIDFEKCFDFI